MLFYLALTIMVLYTIFFLYVDIKDYLNKGGSFGEGMTNPLPNIKTIVPKSGLTCQNGHELQLTRVSVIITIVVIRMGNYLNTTSPSKRWEYKLWIQLKFKEYQIFNKKDLQS